MENSTAPAVKRKPERIRIMSPSRGFNLMSTPCYNSLMVVLTGANDHDCSSDLRQMSAKRPWHFISRRLGDPDVSCAAPSLSQRRDQKLLLYFKGGGSADNFSTEPANNRNFGRGMWREAVQRSDYPSVSRPCRLWQLRARGVATNTAKLPDLVQSRLERTVALRPSDLRTQRFSPFYDSALQQDVPL